MDNLSKWDELIKKYMAGSISDPEMKAIEAHISMSGIKKRQFLELTDPHLFKEKMKVYRDTNREEAWESFLAKVPELTSIASPASSIRMTLITVTTTAATLLVTLLTVLLSDPVTMQPPHTPSDFYLISGIDTIGLPNSGDTTFSLPGLDFSKDGKLIRLNNNNDTIGHPDPTQPLELHTPPLYDFIVVLPDGTKTSVGPTSTLQVHYTAKRETSVTGDFYFAVKKDPTKPFTLRTGSTVITVTGTEFSVSTYSTGVTVEVYEGSVAINNNGVTYTVAASERFQGTPTGDSILKIMRQAPPNFEEKSFHSGYTDIRSIMSKIGRYYGKEVVFEGPFTNHQISVNLSKDYTLQEIFAKLAKQNRLDLNYEYHRDTVQVIALKN